MRIVEESRPLRVPQIQLLRTARGISIHPFAVATATKATVTKDPMARPAVDPALSQLTHSLFALLKVKSSAQAPHRGPTEPRLQRRASSLQPPWGAVDWLYESRVQHPCSLMLTAPEHVARGHFHILFAKRSSERSTQKPVLGRGVARPPKQIDSFEHSSLSCLKFRK